MTAMIEHESMQGEIMPYDDEPQQANGGFSNNASGAATQIQTGRAMMEVQASFAMAKQYPRNDAQVFANVQRACQRKTLAERAEYEFPRGSEKIVGPTIRLIEVIAQQYGNIESGFAEIEQKRGRSTVLCYAVDLQTGYRSTKTFQVEHVRHTKKGRFALTDPRDIYELVANQAMRRVRACIQAVLPGDLVEMAIDTCRKTLKSGNTEALDTRVNKMAAAFQNEFQVSVPMLETYLGHPLKACSENQLARLRRVYTSLRDGIAQREELFDVNAGAGPAKQITPPSGDAQQPPASTAPAATNGSSNGNGSKAASLVADLKSKQQPPAASEPPPPAIEQQQQEQPPPASTEFALGGDEPTTPQPPEQAAPKSNAPAPPPPGRKK
jgi:hypothetical protein